MFRWKDFFYYSKGNRIGITLLLILIFVVGIFYVVLHKFVPLDPSYIAQTEEIEKDFNTFQESLISVPEVTDEDSHENNSTPTKKSSKANPEKLKDGQTIDINAVSAQTLTRIPGIGETFAERIIDYRNALGGFIRLDQLREIKGITMNKYSKVLPYIVLKKPHYTFNINTASVAHPYLNEQQVEAIKAIRMSNKIQSVEDLAESEHFTAKDLERLEPYIRFE